MSLTGALVSLLRGKRFYYDELPPVAGPAAMVPNGAGFRSPAAPGVGSDRPAPASRDTQAAPGA
jgi:hypothetical protein